MEKHIELNRLFEAFPEGYVDRDWLFYLHPKSSIAVPLEAIEDEYDTAKLVVLFASSEAYVGKISPLFFRNWAYRAYLRHGIMDILEKSYSKADFGLMSFLMGDCHNLPLAKTFVEYGANMSVLRRYLKDHDLLADFQQYRDENKLLKFTKKAV